MTQDGFLKSLSDNKTAVTIYIVIGVKLMGVIAWHDQYTIGLCRDGRTQMVYKHAIATVMPNEPPQVSGR